MSSKMIFASEDVRQKNAQVYAQRKMTYRFWLNLNIASCLIVAALVTPFVMEKGTGIWTTAFWTAFTVSILLSGVAEIFRQRAIGAGRGNW